MIFIVYDKNTYKIKRTICASNKNSIKLEKNEEIFDKQVSNLSQKDIRAYNEDGSVKSLQEQIDKGILILEPDEKIDEKEQVVIKLNPAYEDQKIELIERGLETLEPTKKIVKDDNKKYITEKTLEEKFSESLVSVEEINDEVIMRRTNRYSSELDGKRNEILDTILFRFVENGELSITEEEKTVIKELINTRTLIKSELPKY